MANLIQTILYWIIKFSLDIIINPITWAIILIWIIRKIYKRKKTKHINKTLK